YRDGIVEKDHDAVTGELVERTLEWANERPQGAVVFAEEVEHLFRFGGFGEGGVAAQVAKHDDNLAPVAFEDFFVALRHDQLRKLRCQETLEPPDPSQLFDLLGDARFETTIECCYL